jgi:hypothetical protein
MSPEQQRVLLHKHLTGDFPGQRATTVYWLIKHGYVAQDGKSLKVTDKGKQYCDLHHLTMPSGKCA